MKTPLCLGLALLAAGLAACVTNNSRLTRPASRGVVISSPLLVQSSPVWSTNASTAENLPVNTAAPVAWRLGFPFGMVVNGKEFTNRVAEIEVGRREFDPGKGWNPNDVHIEAAAVGGGQYVVQLRFIELVGSDTEEFACLLVTTNAAARPASRPGVKWYPYTQSLFLRATLLLSF